MCLWWILDRGTSDVRGLVERNRQAGKFGSTHVSARWDHFHFLMERYSTWPRLWVLYHRSQIEEWNVCSACCSVNIFNWKCRKYFLQVLTFIVHTSCCAAGKHSILSCMPCRERFHSECPHSAWSAHTFRLSGPSGNVMLVDTETPPPSLPSSSNLLGDASRL